MMVKLLENLKELISDSCLKFKISHCVCIVTGIIFIQHKIEENGINSSHEVPIQK